MSKETGLATMQASSDGYRNWVKQLFLQSHLDEVDLVFGTQGFHELHVAGLVAVVGENAQVGLAPAKVRRRRLNATLTYTCAPRNAGASTEMKC